MNISKRQSVEQWKKNVSVPHKN